MLKKVIIGAALLALAGCDNQSSASAEQIKTSTPEADRSKISQATKLKNDATKTSNTPPEQVLEIASKKIADDMYMLLGPGGNIGVSVGDDGVFVIDDKFERFSDQIISQIKGITDQPIRYVVNTHYHGDHTGANAQMKTAGATIMAHDNVRKRMGMTFENKAFSRQVKATDSSLWPTLTFSDAATLHFNGQTVSIIHTPNAHTDGDSIIYFKEANVLHMGDNFFNGMFPYIDIDGGGSLQGMIVSHEAGLTLINDETKIIPGHGPLAVKADLKKAQELLKTIQKRVELEISKGATLEDILEKDLLKDLESYSSFIKTDNMVKFAHRSLTQ